MTALYTDLLGRAPTSTELSAATATPLSTTIARSSLATMVLHTHEWATTTVKGLYSSILDRTGDTGGVAHWADLIESGRLSAAQVTAQFYASPEFFADKGSGHAEGFVGALYSDILDRNAASDPAGRNYWVKITASAGRYAVAYGLYQSGESRAIRVADLYTTLLGRSPDQVGGAYWTGVIGTRGGRFVAAFIVSSGEYYNDAASRFIPPVLTAPAAPTGVTATGGNGNALVSWTAAADGGSPITKYTVTSSGGQTCTTDGATNCTVDGLTNGTAYTFTVIATNGTGNSAPSGPSAAVTPATATAAPTGVTATGGNSNALVSWTAAADGGSPITKYTVTSSGGQTCTTTGATTCIVDGLTNGTAYTFTVIATNTTGNSVPSGPSAAVTPAAVPAAPTAVTATGGNGNALVSWTAAADGGSAITKYTVTSSGGQTCTTTGETNCTVEGLTNGTSYTFTVIATNSIGNSAPSGTSSPVTPTAATVPNPPSNVTATGGNASATVSWTAAADGGSAISMYTVTSSGGQTCTTDGLASICTVAGLTPGTAYTSTVIATNIVGNSVPSSPSTAVTPGTYPGPPTNLTDVSLGGGSPISSYSAFGGPVSGPGANFSCIMVTTTSCTVTGLTSGVEYEFYAQTNTKFGTASSGEYHFYA